MEHRLAACATRMEWNTGWQPVLRGRNGTQAGSLCYEEGKDTGWQPVLRGGVV
jgi:hypothetical protein